MGCSYDFACRTCKKSYYLGHSSYSSWLTSETLADYDASAWEGLPPKNSLKDLRCNQNIRKCLEEHDGHDHTYVGWDWSHTGYVRDGEVFGALYSDTGPYGTSELFIRDYAEYKKIDLAPDIPYVPPEPKPHVPLKPAVEAQLAAWRERNGVKP